MKQLITKMTFIILMTILCAWNLNAQEVCNVTLSANPLQGGIVAPNDACIFDYGSNATVIAMPEINWKLINWTEDGVVVSEDAIYTFVATGDRNLVANFVPITCEIVLGSVPLEGGVVIGGGVYEYGMVATITAIPALNYEFLYWTNEDGELFTMLDVLSFPVMKDLILFAHFGIAASVEVTVSANPPEGGTVTGGGFYTLNTLVTVTAEAHSGFLFLNWTENGNIVSTEANYSFPMYWPRNFVANFVPATCEITLSKNIEEGGTVVGDGTYSYGQTVIIGAAHNLPEYMFVNWTENGNVVSAMPAISFTAIQSRHLVANFTPAFYGIYVYAYPYEGGTVTGGGTYTYGDQVTLAASANEGYQFLNWTKYISGNGTVVSTDPHYTFAVTGSCAFRAYFQETERILPIEPIDVGTMMIYPNPANSDMTVVLNNATLKIVEMELYDLTGRKVHQQTVNQSQGTLKLNNLAQGTYILKVYLDQGEPVIWRVVKN